MKRIAIVHCHTSIQGIRKSVVFVAALATLFILCSIVFLSLYSELPRNSGILLNSSLLLIKQDEDGSDSKSVKLEPAHWAVSLRGPRSSNQEQSRTFTTTKPKVSRDIYATTESRAVSESRTEDTAVTEPQAPAASIDLSKNHATNGTKLFTTIRTGASQLCTSENCLDYLSISERSIVGKCKRDTLKRPGVTIEKGKCNFLPDGSRKAVALASPEGSGNTWLRGLLEKATGICTGFCCCDTEMRACGFVGEGIMSGKVLVVKTHIAIAQWIGQVKQLQWEGSYGSAIILIRNPAKGLIAEWNRRMSIGLKWRQNWKQINDSHTNVISEALFLNKKWNGFSETYLKAWITRLNNWVFNNPNHPVHVVSYEDLQRDTVGEVEKILDFLEFPYSHDELVERLREDYTTFQRPHTNDDFQHFSPEQKANIRTTLLTVMATAKATGKSDLFEFDDYLESLPHIQ